MAAEKPDTSAKRINELVDAALADNPTAAPESLLRTIIGKYQGDTKVMRQALTTLAVEGLRLMVDTKNGALQRAEPKAASQNWQDKEAATTDASSQTHQLRTYDVATNTDRKPRIHVPPPCAQCTEMRALARAKSAGQSQVSVEELLAYVFCPAHNEIAATANAE